MPSWHPLFTKRSFEPRRRALFQNTRFVCFSVKTQPSIVIGAPLAIFSKVWDLMPATLARQNGSRKFPVRPRRTTQRTVVIGVRPAPTLDQYGLLASTACTFLRRLMFITQRTVVIGARPSPLFPLNGLLASTARTFSNMYVFTLVCSFRRPLVIGAVLAPSLHKKVFRASTACAFSKHLIFVICL